jgi:hypothetical protein
MPPAIRPRTGGEAMHADSRGQVQPADDDVASGRSEQEGVRRSLPGHEATGRSSGSRGFRACPAPGTPPLLAHATTASLTAVIWLASARRGALRHGPGSARTLTLQIQTGQETPIIPNGPFSSPPADPAGARSRRPIEAELSHDRRRGGAAGGMVGSVAFLDALMSSSVREARRASSATDRPRVVRTSYRALPKARALADREPLGIISGFFGARPAGVVAGHLTPAFRRPASRGGGSRARWSSARGQPGRS